MAHRTFWGLHVSLGKNTAARYFGTRQSSYMMSRSCGMPYRGIRDLGLGVSGLGSRGLWF